MDEQNRSEQETQTYLRVAEDVLRSATSALSAREIVDRAVERGLFGDHALSHTPEKSMQARLSVDILNKTASSRFVRVARGRFTLRSKLSSELVADKGLPQAEYIAYRRSLPLPEEEVLCSTHDAFADILTFQGIEPDANSVLQQLMMRPTIYVSRQSAENRNDAKQFVTYVIVQCGQRVLFFRRAYLSRAAEFLRGSRCIGFGGHVTAADADMFSAADRGLSACARRELSEELSFQGATEDTVRLFQQAPLETLGVLNDDSSEVGRRHVAVVYRIWLDDWAVARLLQKGDSSIRGLGWIDIATDRVDLSEFEYWSQLCLRRFYPSIVFSNVGFKAPASVLRRGDAHLVVAGRIGSGKSETANYLSNRLGFPVIKSGILVQRLLGCPPIAEIGRRRFQQMALELIQANEGAGRLAAMMSDAVKLSGSARVVIDGVRHLATYEAFHSLCPIAPILVYIHTPPDVAYDLYRRRESDELGFSYREFLEIYDAPVEVEIPSLGRKAGVHIYNSFGMDAFRRTLDQLANSLGAVSPS